MPEPPYCVSSEFITSLRTPGFGRPIVKSSYLTGVKFSAQTI